MIEINDLTLHWLAGLLEGEGSFTAGSPSHPTQLGIHISMTDEDVIAKVAAIFQVKYHNLSSERSRANGWRDSYGASVRGKKAYELMKLLFPLMGKRRQAQIEKAMTCYKEDTRQALKPEQMEELRQRAQNGENVLELAREYGISKSLAYYIGSGYTYKRA